MRGFRITRATKSERGLTKEPVHSFTGNNFAVGGLKNGEGKGFYIKWPRCVLLCLLQKGLVCCIRLLPSTDELPAQVIFLINPCASRADPEILSAHTERATSKWERMDRAYRIPHKTPPRKRIRNQALSDYAVWIKARRPPHLFSSFINAAQKCCADGRECFRYQPRSQNICCYSF